MSSWTSLVCPCAYFTGYTYRQKYVSQIGLWVFIICLHSDSQCSDEDFGSNYTFLSCCPCRADWDKMSGFSCQVCVFSVLPCPGEEAEPRGHNEHSHCVCCHNCFPRSVVLTGWFVLSWQLKCFSLLSCFTLFWATCIWMRNPNPDVLWLNICSCFSKMSNLDSCFPFIVDCGIFR